MSIQDRIKAPTPPFFAKLRNIGLVLAAVSGAVMASPIAMPAIIVKVAGYLAVAGTVASTVAQAVVGSDQDEA